MSGQHCKVKAICKTNGRRQSIIPASIRLLIDSNDCGVRLPVRVWARPGGRGEGGPAGRGFIYSMVFA